MPDGPPGTTPVTRLTPDGRKFVAALLAVLIFVFALVYSNVAANHAPKPHDLPIGVIGPHATVAVVSDALARSSPDAYTVHAYSSVAAARTAILHRAVYGAYRPAPAPLLLVANASSTAVEVLLQETFAAAAHARGATLAVRDLVPLPPSDPRGTTAFNMLLGLILAGTLGSTIIFQAGQFLSSRRRLLATVALGLGAGLMAALATNIVVAAFPGHFFAVWGVAALFALAIGVPIAAFQALFGLGGTAIGAFMFLVIGNPASGGSSAPEMLPSFWRHLSQLLPPGAANTAMHDVVYFHGHGMTGALLVLAAYTILGIIVVLTVSIVRARRPRRMVRADLVPA
jgi:hypothetical protein